MQTLDSGRQQWAVGRSSAVTNAPLRGRGLERGRLCQCWAWTSWQISALLRQFCLELKTALKNKFLIKKCRSQPLFTPNPFTTTTTSERAGPAPQNP